MTAPDFFIVGASRSGTTTLHASLRRHPQVFLPAHKSQNYFVAEDPTPSWETAIAARMARQMTPPTRAAYLAQFARAGGRVSGEASPLYLQSVHAAKRVHRHNPKAKIVAILRNPVDRAYAHFIGRQRDGLLPEGPFETRLAEERASGMPNEVAFGHCLGIGRYHVFLRPYFAHFPRNQIQILLFEDLVADPAGTLAQVCAFLDIEPLAPDAAYKQHNRGGHIPNRALRRLWTGTSGLRTTLRPLIPQRARDGVGWLFLKKIQKPPLRPETRAELEALYREDTQALALLIDRNLAQWDTL